MSETAFSIVHDEHWTRENYRQRVTTKQLQVIRLTETIPWLWRGGSYVLKHRYVGAGIYEIWMEPGELR